MHQSFNNPTIKHRLINTTHRNTHLKYHQTFATHNARKLTNKPPTNLTLTVNHNHNTTTTHHNTNTNTNTTTSMADKELKTLIQQLHATKPATLAQAPQLLSRAKLALLHLNALLPTDSTSADHLALARETLELGAFLSIRLRDTDAFTRYFQQLQPFYALPAAQTKASRGAKHGNESKVTGLYLLLLLSVGDYAGFHTLLEGLESSEEGKEAVEKDEFVRYPVRLEQALMEGSYDKVWSEMKSERVPSEEFAIFSEVRFPIQLSPSTMMGGVPGPAQTLPYLTSLLTINTYQVLINTIRSEIASCSERAYPSLPISNAKNLLFLDSEGAVVQFAQARGWLAKDGRIYFPEQEAEAQAADKDVMSASGTVIENTLGYARKLETIV
jgi:26S proteasome regulatory subunit N12